MVILSIYLYLAGMYITAMLVKELLYGHAWNYRAIATFILWPLALPALLVVRVYNFLCGE